MSESHLSQQLKVLASLVEANPCHMSRSSMDALSDALSVMTSKDSRLDMTMEEVSLWLGVSIKTIERWQKSRGFPVTKIKGKTGHLFSCIEVLEWCRQNDIYP